MNRLSVIPALLVLFFTIGTAQAQTAQNPLSLNNRAVLFGTQQAASDPVSSVMPGTAFGSGLGAYIDNPASLALLVNGLAIEFGITYRSLQEEVLFQGVTNESNRRSSGLSNFNLLYSKAGEGRGLIIGAGFTDHSVYDRTMGLNSFNDNSTITDVFKNQGSPYHGIARSAGVIVAGDDTEKWFDSVFRAGESPGTFPGIRQQADILQSGEGGELSFVLATELQPDFFVGISMGYLSGDHIYSRVFQEIDEKNQFQGPLNDEGGSEASVYSLTLEDQLETSYSGLRTRVGIIYRILPAFTIGGSYTFPTTVTAEESMSGSLRVRRDPFDSENDLLESTGSEMSFDVQYPSLISVGAALTGISGFSASVSFDYADYRQIRIDFADSELFDLGVRENEIIRKEYAETLSIRGGVAWDMNEEMQLRAGYSVFPSIYLGGTDWKRVISLGASLQLSEKIRLDFGVRYLMADDKSVIYNPVEYNYSNQTNGVPASVLRSETAASGLTQVLFTSNAQIRF